MDLNKEKQISYVIWWTSIKSRLFHVVLVNLNLVRAILCEAGGPQ